MCRINPIALFISEQGQLKQLFHFYNQDLGMGKMMYKMDGFWFKLLHLHGVICEINKRQANRGK